MKLIQFELQMITIRLRQNLRSETGQRVAWFCAKETQR